MVSNLKDKEDERNMIVLIQSKQFYDGFFYGPSVLSL